MLSSIDRRRVWVSDLLTFRHDSGGGGGKGCFWPFLKTYTLTEEGGYVRELFHHLIEDLCGVWKAHDMVKSVFATYLKLGFGVILGSGPAEAYGPGKYSEISIFRKLFGFKLIIFVILIS